jgi:inorganic pyrophosphatase
LQDVADACRTGAATDIIFGLALGYKSTIIPCFVLAVTIYIANSLAGVLAQLQQQQCPVALCMLVAQ